MVGVMFMKSTLERMKRFDSLEYICVYYDSDKLPRCSKDNCTGITNSCGLYKNCSGKDPFKDCFKYRPHWK